MMSLNLEQILSIKTKITKAPVNYTLELSHNSCGSGCDGCWGAS